MDLLRARAWCNVLELRVKERAAVLEKARLAVDAVWKELMIATNEREGMDRLYKRRRALYERQVQVSEQKVLDELGLQLTQPSAFRGLTNPGAR
jgi:flagellar biosynthesis chaperone FliJ